MFFYRNYTFSPLATICSALLNLVAGLAACIGIAMITDGKAVSIVIGAVFTLIGIFMFFFVSKKITDKIAETNGRKNIETKASYALTYCIQHPEEVLVIMEKNPAFAQKMRSDVSYAHRISNAAPALFNELAQINPELSSKFEINEKGKVKKIKN